MLKKLIVLLAFVNFYAASAVEQYSEGTCVLLKNQINQFSYNKQLSQYKSSKRTYDKHCVNPVVQTTNIASVGSTPKAETRLKPLDSLPSQQNYANSKPLQQTNTQKAVTQSVTQTGNPATNLLGLVIKAGTWFLVGLIVLTIIKTLMRMFIKRAATKLANGIVIPINKKGVKLRSKVEPKMNDVAPPSEQSNLKAVINDIVNSGNQECINTTHGNEGEAIVNQVLTNLVNDLTQRYGDVVTQYSNVILTTEANEFTEIDHLIVSPVGVFVIESKNYSGFIFGSEKQPKWTQALRGVKTQFMNPLRQNYKHCIAVNRLLGVLDGVESVIVFHNKAQFKTDMPKNVIYLSQLSTLINRFTAEKFTHNQLVEFNRRLSIVVNATSDADRKAHINEVKNKITQHN